MTVTTLNTTDVSHPTTHGSLETMTQSTATSIQNLSVHAEISVLGMGTATSFVRNRYLLPTTGAVEGMEKVIISNATGEAYVMVNNVGPTAGGTFPIGVIFVLNGSTATDLNTIQAFATATGCIVFNAADDMLVCKFRGGWWRITEAYGCTLATST